MTTTTAAKKWYVLKVQSSREDAIRKALVLRIKSSGLEESFGQISIPSESVSEIKQGQKRITERKTYPGYIIVEMALSEDSMSLVRETPGVGDFVGPRTKPTPLLEREVEKLKGDMERPKEAPRLRISFKKGDSVKIKDGPFENFEGILDEVFEQKGIVRVIVTIFGRPTPVELEYWQVEPM
ncbi:MAG: transcription termination/antitermination protein NusG [Planctomycetota bacterium]